MKRFAAIASVIVFLVSFLATYYLQEQSFSFSLAAGFGMIAAVLLFFLTLFVTIYIPCYALSKLPGMNVFELCAVFGLIGGAYFGATFGLQHSIIFALAAGIIGAPLGLISGVLAAFIFFMPFQLLSIIANKIEKKAKAADTPKI